MNGINPKEKKQRPKYNFWQNSAYMIALAWKMYKSVVLLAAALAVLATSINIAELLIGPVILRKVENTAPIVELLVTIGAFSGLLFTLRACKAYVSANILFGRVAVRAELARKVQYKLAVTSYPNTEDSSVLKKLENAKIAVDSNERATEAIWNTLSELLKNVINFGVYLMLMSALNPVLVLVILLSTITGYIFNKRIHEWEYRHREEEAGYSRRMTYISGKSGNTVLAKDVRILGLAPWLEDVFQTTLKAYQAFVLRREKKYIWANIIEVVLTFLRNGAAYAYLLTITLRNGLPASEFLLYFSAVGGFAVWVAGILEQCALLHRQSLDITEVREFLEISEPFQFEDGLPVSPDLKQNYEIKLQNVTFRYPGAKKDTLRHINLTITSGEKLAVVGLNGAGKSTLVKLICGFYDPTEGEVLLNGINIKTYNRKEYYRHFSAVFQQFSVLEVTVAENITQSLEEIDEERLKDCIEKAGLKARIDSLPQGIYTHIGRKVYEDGVELSGGEMQRLMLARALYKNGPILILDEPTAALDPITENEIYLKYNEMTAGRTSIFISHRLASTRFCDRIIYLEQGIIKEEGTHEQLQHAGGKYEALYEIQSRYYGKGGGLRAGSRE